MPNFSYPSCIPAYVMTILVLLKIINYYYRNTMEEEDSSNVCSNDEEIIDDEDKDKDDELEDNEMETAIRKKQISLVSDSELMTYLSNAREQYQHLFEEIEFRSKAAALMHYHLANTYIENCCCSYLLRQATCIK